MDMTLYVSSQGAQQPDHPLMHPVNALRNRAIASAQTEVTLLKPSTCLPHLSWICQRQVHQAFVLIAHLSSCCRLHNVLICRDNCVSQHLPRLLHWTTACYSREVLMHDSPESCRHNPSPNAACSHSTFDNNDNDNASRHSSSKWASFVSLAASNR